MRRRAIWTDWEWKLEMKVAWRAIVAGLALVSMTPLADAAKVVPLSGEILVNSGAGYHRITEAVELKPGDAAIAEPNAQASLIYDDGCAIDVRPGMVAWVEPTSPCEKTSDRIRDPDTTLMPSRVFDPGWLVDGAARLPRHRDPAGP